MKYHRLNQQSYSSERFLMSPSWCIASKTANWSPLKIDAAIDTHHCQLVAAKVIVFAAAIMVLSSMNKDFAQKFQV